ncbi:MAG: hypothetical protein ACREEB_17460 [Caulobacteraceae bacterium]
MSFDTPPRARLAFRVGVVGHRPDRLPVGEDGLAEVRTRISEVLEILAGEVRRFAAGPDSCFYEPEAAPILAANSPLAEGADRIFAEEALRQGYRLTCVMPFAREEFERDFAAPGAHETGSIARFDAILSEAEAAGALTRFELDGRREREHEAYEAAGRVVLNQSDLLIAIWDGGAANGIGGTFDTLRQAIDFNVPTLWIDSRAPHGWRLLREASDLDCLASDESCPPCALPPKDSLVQVIEAVVNGELAPFEPEREHLLEYFAETRPRRNLALTWKLFRDFMDRGAITLPTVSVTDFVDQIRSAWPVVGDPAQPGEEPSEATSWINTRLRAHYAWSDKLADLYADAHRSGFVNASLLAATAVFTALLPVAGNFGQRAAVTTAVVEALILAAMIGLPLVARRRRWHQKWLEYRVLAELVRELRILIPFGGANPPPRTAAHLASYGDPSQSWMNWQARAIARATGLPEARIGENYVAARCAGLIHFLGSAAPPEGQIGFHHTNCERMERIHQRLHRMSLILFTVTMAAVAANWTIRFFSPGAPERVTAWLILFSAFLPALGAAFASINNQGEFARLQRRFRAMAQSLVALRDRIAVLASEPSGPELARVSEIAAQIASMMVDENTEWRIVVLDLPHAAG